MITRVDIKNYRSIAEIQVEMDPMTVLVGRNGSGKSSFVDAIKLVVDALRVGLDNAIVGRHGFASIRRWAPRRKRQLEIALFVQRPNFEGSYELVLGSDGEGFKILREKASYQLARHSPDSSGPEGHLEPEADFFERQADRWITRPDSASFGGRPQFTRSLETTALALPGLNIFQGFMLLQRYLAGNFYTIFPNTLRQPQKPMTERVLSDHGDNFVSVLQHITHNTVQKAEILSVLSRAVEGVCDIRVRSAGGYLVAELQHDDLGPESAKNGSAGTDANGPWFDLSQESDGTLRMLGLLAAIYQAPALRVRERTLLALEKPEIALHPGALAILADELLAASKRRQLLVTTQSADLIARTPVNHLRVVERRNGMTQISPIEETQRKVIEDQLFDAGELLRIEGLRGREQ